MTFNPYTAPAALFTPRDRAPHPNAFWVPMKDQRPDWIANRAAMAQRQDWDLWITDSAGTTFRVRPLSPDRRWREHNAEAGHFPSNLDPFAMVEVRGAPPFTKPHKREAGALYWGDLGATSITSWRLAK